MKAEQKRSAKLLAECQHRLASTCEENRRAQAEQVQTRILAPNPMLARNLFPDSP